MLIALVAGFSFLGSVGAMAGAALLIASPARVRSRLLPGLVSYATGTLLGAAFLAMVPTALEHLDPSVVGVAVLAGIVGFFVLEKLVLWRHCHEPGCEVHTAAGPLILVGDALHNLLDGVVIAAAFLSSVPLGIATALAVIAHEVPQELGDFAILLDSGYPKRTAFWYNLLSSASTLPGAILGYLYLEVAQRAVPYVLAVSAAGFLYVALADLIPSLHRRVGPLATALQSALVLAGMGTIAVFQLGR